MLNRPVQELGTFQAELRPTLSSSFWLSSHMSKNMTLNFDKITYFSNNKYSVDLIDMFDWSAYSLTANRRIDMKYIQLLGRRDRSGGGRSVVCRGRHIETWKVPNSWTGRRILYKEILMNSAVSSGPGVRQKMDQGRGVGVGSIGCNASSLDIPRKKQLPAPTRVGKRRWGWHTFGVCPLSFSCKVTYEHQSKKILSRR